MVAERVPLEEPGYRLLFESSPFPYLILKPDAAFTIIAVNDRYLGATGTRRADILGKGLFEVFPDNPDDHSGSGVSDLRTSLERVIRDKVPDQMGVQKYDIPRRDAEGFEVKYWSPENTPVFAPDGGIAFIIHHVEDITDFVLARERMSREQAERIEQATDRADRMEAEVMRRANEVKEANRQIKAAMEKVEAANRAKSVFLANMSHELRTPLNAILGFARLMRNTPEVTNEQVRHLEIIVRSGEHLLNLINNVLEISKIESGHVALEESEFDLHSLLYETQSMMNVAAAQKRLQFGLNLAPGTPRYVMGDSGKLRQIIINLLANAIKFTQTGSVSLEAALAGQHSTDSARVLFRVNDTGRGIRNEDVQRLFSAFVQLGTNPHAQAGTGLGLFICKQYVALMGGSIEVDTVSGKGSSFRFEIPLRLSETGDRSSARVPSRRVVGLADGQPRHHRLLIAEDQPDNRLLLRKLLEPFGFELREAVNGREAVALVRKWRPHLVWMDIRMPVMDGLKATRQIKATAAGAATKIVAVTAHALEEEREEILAAGCDDFIRKPYRDSEIYDAMERHLGIQFVYAEDGQTVATAMSRERCTEDFTKLPAPLIDKLKEAALLLDSERCGEIAGEIAKTDGRLGAYVLGLIENLQFHELIEALESAAAAKAQ